jgi:hypothetical protein
MFDLNGDGNVDAKEFEVGPGCQKKKPRVPVLLSALFRGLVWAKRKDGQRTPTFVEIVS